ncbi:MAG: holo-ACP synthase [Oscillospiraceae bacterium]
MITNGIDLIEIGRIKKSLESPSFFEKVFGEEEKKELIKKNIPCESVAGAFAAKEAFSKALKTGIRNFSLSEVQVLHDELGAPYLSLSGNALEIAKKKNLSFALSITHTKEYAAAFVTAFTNERN